jgi:hypothetical protein
VWGADAQHVYAVGEMGTILFSSGTGTWTKKTSPSSDTLEAVGGTVPTEVYAVGHPVAGGSGTIIHTNTASGDNWVSDVVPPGAKDLKAIWASVNDMYVVGLSGTILHR